MAGASRSQVVIHDADNRHQDNDTNVPKNPSLLRAPHRPLNSIDPVAPAPATLCGFQSSQCLGIRWFLDSVNRPETTVGDQSSAENNCAPCASSVRDILRTNRTSPGSLQKNGTRRRSAPTSIMTISGWLSCSQTQTAALAVPTSQINRHHFARAPSIGPSSMQ